MTFGELFEASNRVARALFVFFDKNTLTANDNESWIIGIQMKPSVNVIVTMLAIWKCGAAYWPINSFYNRKRTQKILTQVKPQLLIIDDDYEISNFFHGFLVMKISALMESAEDLDTSYVIDDLSFSLGKDCEAMTIYTSGTLEEPKGTILHHSCCQQRLEWQWKKFPFTPEENCCMARNALFHIDHFSEMWGTLCAGKCLVIVKNEFRKDPQQLTRIMEKFDIKRFTGLPSTIDEIVSFLLERKRKLEMNVSLWMSTGEPLTIKVADKFFALFAEGDRKLVNCFGCTETTGECAWFTIESKEQLDQLEGAEIPLGWPTFNTFIYVMNENLSPTTEMGEIFVSGEFLAQYYVDVNEESQTIFHNHLALMPTHTRLFRTKDYGVLRNGFLYHRGRVGRMVTNI
jgi:iturin family lipopeptide synthetase A